jgi:ATP-dependent protease Clp ATPase subunit
MLHIMYDIPSRPNVRKILITEETVQGRDEPQMFMERERGMRA